MDKKPNTGDVIPKGTTATLSSLNERCDTVSDRTVHVPPSHEKPAIQEEKLAEAVKNLEDDWENDPENPRNWPWRNRWVAMSIVSLYTFLPPLASSMMAPGLPDVAKIYNITNPTVVALTLSVFLITFGIGPLVLAPLSEMYGRKWVLDISNIFTVIFSLGCAFAPTTGVLIVFRLLSGFCGSAPVSIGGGTVSDLFAERDRAPAMALYTVGPLFGPTLGPIASGFIVQSLGIKWVFIVIAITAGVASAVGIPFLRETYGPVLRARKARRTADPEARANALPVLVEARGSKLYFIWINLTRPIVLLTRSLICFMLSLYMAFMYGIYYLMFATFASFFSKTYGFDTAKGGLTYLGLGIGCMSATVFGAKVANQIYNHLAEKNGGTGKPEMRLPALLVGSLLVPIGIFWYGWSAQAKLPWIMPIIGSGIFGFGFVTVFLPTALYLVDSFTYAASATAAASVFRCMLGFAFPLFGTQMYDAMGNGGGNSLLAGLAIVLGIPFPIWLYYKGEGMRARNPLTRK